MVPHLSYLVCATPRSGTGLLAGLLQSIGIAGRPKEYFWEHELTAAYLEKVVARGTTPNGVFGATVMWAYFGSVLSALAAFRDLRFVWLRRENAVAQAVSHLRAIQTNAWYAGGERRPGGEPRFDRGAIDHLVAEIAGYNRSWGAWFARQELQPLCLTYEAVAAEPVTATKEVLDFLGLPRDVVVDVQTRQQADELNADWIARYRALRP